MAKGKYQEWLTPEGLTKIQGWARDGLSEEQIAHNMGITRPTLWKWKENHDNILNALKKGKEVVDREVENALHKRAMGYKYKEKTYEPDENGDMVLKKVIEKQVAPDTTAQIFWLKNRKPTEWRDKHEIDNKHEFGENFVLKIKKEDE